MANNKTGLSYYNVDTDRYQDIRIKRLKNAFGCSGIAVYDYILCEIYRVKGCFLVWDESSAFDVADYFGLKENLVIEIVNYCGVVGLFDRALLTCGSVSKSTQAVSQCSVAGDGSSVPACGGVITSKSIQSRYIEMCTRAKRKDFEIPDEYRIIPDECKIEKECETESKLPEESGKLPEESTKLPEVCPKTPEVCDKVKKSKVKKSKIYGSPEGDLSGNAARPLFPFDECLNFVSQFNKIRGTHYQATKEVRTKFNARLKEGFTPAQMIEALKNAMQSKTHIESNFEWLTPEFFTRSSKIDMYLNRTAKAGAKPDDWAAKALENLKDGNK